MKQCPVCQNDTKNKRCVTPSCSAYSQKVIESEISDSVKRRLLKIADTEDYNCIPPDIGNEILEALWNGEPISLKCNTEADGLILQELDIHDSETRIYDGWGSCVASGSVIINGFEFHVSFDGTESHSNLSLEIEEDE